MECHICFNSYNNNNNIPMIFSCGHTICSSCLRNLLNERRLKCPTCSKALEGNSIENYSKNFNLIEIINETNKEGEEENNNINNTNNIFNHNIFLRLNNIWNRIYQLIQPIGKKIIILLSLIFLFTLPYSYSSYYSYYSYYSSYCFIGGLLQKIYIPQFIISKLTPLVNCFKYLSQIIKLTERIQIPIQEKRKIQASINLCFHQIKIFFQYANISQQLFWKGLGTMMLAHFITLYFFSPSSVISKLSIIIALFTYIWNSFTYLISGCLFAIFLLFTSQYFKKYPSLFVIITILWKPIIDLINLTSTIINLTLNIVSYPLFLTLYYCFCTLFLMIKIPFINPLIKLFFIIWNFQETNILFFLFKVLIYYCNISLLIYLIIQTIRENNSESLKKWPVFSTLSLTSIFFLLLIHMV